jgi:hypothetical protein
MSSTQAVQHTDAAAAAVPSSPQTVEAHAQQQPTHQLGTKDQQQPKVAEKEETASTDSKRRVVSTSYFSTTIHKPGQPSVYFSRTENTDEDGVVLGTEERRIGDKKAFTTWKVNSDAKSDPTVQNSYENADAGEFETTWAGLKGAPAALTSGGDEANQAAPVAKLDFDDSTGEADNGEAKEEELPVLGSAPTSPSATEADVATQPVPTNEHVVEAKKESTTPEVDDTDANEAATATPKEEKQRHAEIVAADEKTQTDQQKQALVESKEEPTPAAAGAKEEKHAKEEKQSDESDESPYVYYVVRQTPVVKRRPRRSLFDSFFDVPQHPFSSYGRRPLQRGYSRRPSPFYFGDVPAVYHSAPSRQYSPFTYGSPAYYPQQRPLFFY